MKKKNKTETRLHSQQTVANDGNIFGVINLEHEGVDYFLCLSHAPVAKFELGRVCRNTKGLSVAYIMSKDFRFSLFDHSYVITKI